MNLCNCDELISIIIFSSGIVIALPYYAFAVQIVDAMNVIMTPHTRRYVLIHCNL